MRDVGGCEVGGYGGNLKANDAHEIGEGGEMVKEGVLAELAAAFVDDEEKMQ